MILNAVCPVVKPGETPREAVGAEKAEAEEEWTQTAPSELVGAFGGPGPGEETASERAELLAGALALGRSC